MIRDRRQSSEFTHAHGHLKHAHTARQLGPAGCRGGGDDFVRLRQPRTPRSLPGWRLV
ncbi:uncharacterized protein K452DRAFT_17759 [Aplosporella prunicola CBS 121167]|uniref:Uncharacterized protein n=1 Tax=Aplosporella prunicola CBS 121167 TaxID=1176127 RepID=A0A6A6BG56_9PEZI|nr:uncharacterized protein K452DRAFT_17759 [Aplosporella prunicola CBS 121167]KAF2142383.1 hypothetical protein K452DRAFT_17759 [Aplosporella prunicola CBS 121167]